MQPEETEADWVIPAEGVWRCFRRCRPNCKRGEALEAVGFAGCCSFAVAAAVAVVAVAAVAVAVVAAAAAAAGCCRRSSSWMVVLGRRTVAGRRWGFVR